MWLKMYIGRTFVEQYRLDYSGMQTATEREQYQQGIARDMYANNARKISFSCVEPEFFVDNVPSKMNDIDFETATWQHVKETIS